MSPAKTDSWPVTVVPGAPGPELLQEIQTVIAAAEDADGNPPFSEQTLVELKSAHASPQSVLTLLTYAPEDASPTVGEDLAGVAVVVLNGNEGVLEIVVHPAYRNDGVGAILADKLVEVRGLHGIKAWSHGDHEAAADLAASYGFRAIRELWRMRLVRQAPSSAEPQPTLEYPAPDGVSLRTFVPDQDEGAWVAANASAFAHHPEQGALTLADLQARMAEPWFDPAGFFLAVNASQEILGFHWTKLHPARAGQAAMGEVYVVGVIPDAQGLGLGKILTKQGIDHLQNAGLRAIMLYVDADNEAAVSLYRKLGFTKWDSDVMYGPLSP
ncbi:MULTISPECIES: mycothiol synthase [Arthrobacter]|uniref:Mycothiol acetyltransferase n=1 Tax=Arthrobacter psychrochitiniphilus TaxID=291045 RepID=A0A2V3DUC3_9MICC|nr:MULTISPECIES: mycothiol synthase [Arthrobacter]NYG18740.1 mycothiol synthase [Arthrobacter psychrochitiniphilus]PXA66332.1 mycothiol synthase [Arthrobacter psychrochitiniphilus]